MISHPLRRFLALLVSASLLASLAVATVASPASAAKPRCQGKVATIVGTNGGERILGTNTRDIIVAKGGNDRIYGRGGNDIICAGGGNDVVFGGRGIDRLWGQAGHDKLYGNAGPDFLAGQVGNDTLVGGIGIDTCFQGTGFGPVVRCERPVAPSPAPPGYSLIPLTGIHAVAYSDVDGLDGYSTGDVLIAKLVDSYPDGVPGWGDTVVMGRYPLNLAATAFADWGVTEHVVDIAEVFPDQIRVHPADGDWFEWRNNTGVFSHEKYYESQTSEGDGYSNFLDTRYQFESDVDGIWTEKTSPSEPAGADRSLRAVQQSDDVFLDVEIVYHEP